MVNSSTRLMARCGAVILLLMMAGCSEEPAQPGEQVLTSKTLAIGKFQLTGSAQTGQYARQLFKVDRLLSEELARSRGWQMVESARINELLEEFSVVTEEPGRMDRLLDGMVDKIVGPQGNEQTDSGSQQPVAGLPRADYLLVGEMDGFDVYFDDSAQTVNGVARTLQNRARRARARLAFRVIDVNNRKWLLSHSRNIEIILADERSAESQIDLALAAMVKEAVATIGQEEALQVVSATAPQGSASESVTASTTGGLTVRPVRVAFGGFSILHPNFDAEAGAFTQGALSTVKAAAVSGVMGLPELVGIKAVAPELEAMISHRLKTAAGLTVMEQDAARVKKLLAQQVLTDLSKGRQPGLPMGTLRGVDYLVFGTIHDMRMETSKPQFVEGVAMSRGGKPRNGKSRMHLYMQDVNTGENVLSQELNVDFPLQGYKSVEDGLSALLTHIADKSIANFLLSMRPLEVLWAGPGTVLLNHGQMAGLAAGDELLVYNRGQDIPDPYTGVVMKGVGSTQVGSVRISGFSATGWAEADVISGSGFVPGFPLRLTQESVEDAIEEESPPMMKPAW